MNIEKYKKEFFKRWYVDNNCYLNDYQKICYKLLIDGCSTIDEVGIIIGILMVQCRCIKYQLNYSRRNTFRIWF